MRTTMFYDKQAQCSLQADFEPALKGLLHLQKRVTQNFTHKQLRIIRIRVTLSLSLQQPFFDTRHACMVKVCEYFFL